MTVTVRDENFELRPEKCLYWPRHELLVIADLHLGKSETFQQQGLWLPSQANADDLRRIEYVVAQTSARHVLFLGDLVHSARGITPELRRMFGDWIDSFDGRVSIVIGNHDRHLLKKWPQEWVRADLQELFEFDDFVFQHEPPDEAEGPHDIATPTKFFWVGHVHPVVRLQLGPDHLRLPSFVISDSVGLLPAFSSLAGGHEIFRSKKHRVFPVTETKVFSI